MTPQVNAVGMDLGNTNTMLAFINNKGATEILKTAEGALYTPSVVYFDDARTVVGEEALLRGRKHPQRLAANVKNELGRNYYHQPIGTAYLPPDVIQACLLRGLRNTIELRLLGERRLAIAVPASFNEQQRRSLKVAAEIAGIYGCELVDEPIAAVLAYAEMLPLIFVNSSPQERCLFLVINVGGYASEVSLIALENNELTTLATEYDSNLGGHEWDLKLVDWHAQQKIKSGQPDPRNSPLALQRLLEAAAQWKIKLDASPRKSHPQTNIGNGFFQIDVEEFETLTLDLRKRVEKLVDKVLTSGHLAANKPPHLLLVGGASQMHFVQEMVRRKADAVISPLLNPTELIARGAARFAMRHLVASSAVNVVQSQLENVCMHAIGLEMHDSATGHTLNDVLIPRGTRLPVEVVKQLVTKTKDNTFTLSLTQGGYDGKDDRPKLIGRAVISNIPPDAADDWPLDLSLKMGIHGRITLDAVVRYTPCSAHLVLHRPDCVSSLHLQRWQSIVEQQGGLASYVETAQQEQAVALQTPVAVTPVPPADAIDSHAAEDHATSSLGVLDFIKRMMPSFFRKFVPSTQASSTAASSIESKPPVVPTRSRLPPPMLEIVPPEE